MEHGESGPAKKRRIPKACSACRRSKLRCDERRPCSRCVGAKVECVYFERPKDPNVVRIEHLEAQLDRINQKLSLANAVPHQQGSPATTYSVGSNHVQQESGISWPPTSDVHGYLVGSGDGANETSSSDGGLVGYTVRQTSAIDIVSSGLVSETDARSWVSTFFRGCIWYVPIFDQAQDTFDSIRARSNILFDTIVVIGERATHGALSKGYQSLYPVLRQHTSDLILRLSGTNSRSTVEEIQALLVIASYSDSGAILCDVAAQACIKDGLPQLANDYLVAMSRQAQQSPFTADPPACYPRVWYYLYVLDMILSVDGGKPATITIPPSAARRVRLLLKHEHCTAADVRLYAQVELNSLRSEAHASISSLATTIVGDDAIDNILQGAVLDLDLWLSDWKALLSAAHVLGAHFTTVLLNIQIQHAWAILVLHLRALTATGIDNIALMTDKQRDMAVAAKTAAERHFQLVMTRSEDNTSPQLPYVASFRYAMEFVWAKNAFCVLIVLRLSILLGDSMAQLSHKLTEARDFLNELEKVGMGANTRVLSQIVEKCEHAVRATLQVVPAGDGTENDFQSFVPKEFMFDWDFPGVHLHYIPLDWQDLLFDIGMPT